MITEQCNLHCAYCFEIDKGPIIMPVQIAKDILDKEMSADSQFVEY